MTCDPERLSNYLDGELSPAEEAELHQHLTTCVGCTDELAAYRRVDDSFRALADPPTPRMLRASLYRRLEARRRSRFHRVLSSPLLAPALPITAAVLVAGGVAAWRQLPAGSAPVMTAAFAIQELPDTLDGLRVQLVFDRAVAPDSLDEAVQVEPPLPFAQRVHENRVELIPQAPVSPGTTYRLTVNNVRDQRGNAQSTPVVLNLRAGPAALVVQESSPAEAPRLSTDAVAQTAGPMPAAVAQRESGNATESTQPRGAPPAAADRTEMTPDAPAPTSAPLVLAQPPTMIPTPRVPPVVDPAAVSTTAAVAQSGGPSFSSDSVTTPALPTPAATASPLPSGAASISPSLPPVSQITQSKVGAAITTNALTPPHRLGATLSATRTVQLGEQAYQGGAMLSRHDTNQIVVLIRSTGRWLGFGNTWRPGEVLPPAGARPPGTWEPLRGFGKLWREQPAVKSQLGWPVFEERNAAGSVQSFDNGTLVRTAFGVAYALFSDGTWHTMPDRR